MEKFVHTFLVKKLQSRGEVVDDVAGLLLGEPDPVLDVVQELSSVDLLEDEVESVWLLEVLDELDDVLVPVTVVEGLDLLEHPGPAVSGDLVDDLDRVLDVGPDRPACADRGVGPLSQDLPGQLVRVQEGGGHQRGAGLLLLPPPGLGLLLPLSDLSISLVLGHPLELAWKK